MMRPQVHARFNAGLGILAAPVSYAVNGKQYVSVLVGHGGSTFLKSIVEHGWKYGAQPRRLLTFVLDGAAKLPPTAPPDFTWKPVDDPALKIDDVTVAQGRVLFVSNCGMCHGRDAVSRGAPAPDFRESRVALHAESLWTVIHDGVLLPRGMPRFDELSRDQVNAIHAFIRSEARKALAAAP